MGGNIEQSASGMMPGAKVTMPYHLSKAPIKEAAIEFRVSGDVNVGDLDFDLNGFAKGTEIQTMELQLELHGPRVEHKESRSHVGYRHEADDGKDIAQVTTSGLTFSRLTPYKDWDTFSSLAKDVWRQYIEVVGTVSIDRLGVRYVNRLNVPYFDEYSLDDYFTNAPKLFMKSKSGVEHFLTRLVLKLNHTQDINAVVIQTIDKPTDNILPLILDIDVSAQLIQEDQADIWSLLDRLREYKNDIFFHTMTPRSLDLCE